MSAGLSKFVQVVIASPVRHHFDYLPAEGLKAADYLVGSRVEVPFGRRNITGIVIGHCQTSSIAADKLKAIRQKLDSTAIVSEDLLSLAEWMSNYYHHPYGDTLLSLLPNQLRKGGSIDAYSQYCWKITPHGLGLPDDALQRAPKQAELLNFLRTAERAETDTLTSETILKEAGHSRASALELAKKGLASSVEQGYYPADCQSILQGQAQDKPPTLNAEQIEAGSLIADRLGSFDTVLLEGITGSGKTEVYLRAIDKVLSLGQQVLVLVPEIGLTPQTINRFVDRFDVPIAIFHSGLTDRERLAAWTAASDGVARIIIGTRSAVFTPMANAGLIIIDEEHDGSYKQQDSLRYSARDIAIIRARNKNIPVVLGSATPSLETLFNAQTKKYQHSVLKNRAGSASPPSIELLDIRRQVLHEGLSDNAIAAIGETLSSGQQAMVFVNRRGFAPLLMCHDCGWHAQCDHCDARLTLHNRPHELHCHHCGHRAKVPTACPRCQSSRLLQVGQGTQRSAEALTALFPRFPVIRIDRDSTQGKQAMGERVDLINRGEPAILVGTQMLAKGHHFPALNLVVVLDIDQGLYNPDFRGPEKTVQLLTQVAGRAGRAGHGGKVLIQTHMPEHPLLQIWQTESYQGIIETLLNERSLRTLPPYAHIALIRADSPKPEQALRFLNQLAQQQTNTLNQSGCQLIGPLAAFMEKRAGRHRAQLMIKSEQRKSLHSAVKQLIQSLDQSKKPSGLRWSIDIDPQDVI
ncbi:MAG: primosomal protein N' [Pseudomonadales bacterium]|nr:primosomal protein N' [Pseudomonadales bacterium]